MEREAEQKETDLETLAEMLRNAGILGLSFPQIYDLAAAKGDPWSYRTINMLMCEMWGETLHRKVKVKKGGKVTTYYLKECFPGGKLEQ